MGRIQSTLLLCLYVLTPFLVEAQGSTAQGYAEEQLATRAYFLSEYQEAVPHFLAAANAGNTEAYSYLGNMYEHGYGVPRDYAKAAEWLKKSVGSGYSSDRADLDKVLVNLGVTQQSSSPSPQIAQAQAAPDTPQPDAQQKIARRQQADQEDADRQQRIEQLKADIEVQQNSAASWDKSVQDMIESNNNNCNMSGLTGLFCHGIGAAGIAKAKKEAAKARNQIASDQEELERLQGLEVQSRPRQDASFGGNFQQAAAIVQQTSPAQAVSSSGASVSSSPEETYDPNRHYSGPNADQVSTLLSRSFGWSCPASSTASVSWQPPEKQVCMRDSYVIAAVSLAYGAECEARLGRVKEATEAANAMAENIANAKKLCSNAPVIANSGPGCSTLKLVPCP